MNHTDAGGRCQGKSWSLINIIRQQYVNNLVTREKFVMTMIKTRAVHSLEKYYGYARE
jgi:hypothetical protein